MEVYDLLGVKTDRACRNSYRVQGGGIGIEVVIYVSLVRSV